MNMDGGAEYLVRLVQRLPLETAEFVFAYGSGVLAQANRDDSEKMIDFILVVSDAEKFHSANLQANPGHYSFLRWGGPQWLARFQKEFAARLYFNTLIRVPPSRQLIKYGVIERKDFLVDLLDWESLYVSGRLHKPVILVHNAIDSEMSRGLKLNLKSAIHAALLLLPEQFSLRHLFETVAGLSYRGDFRVLVGEDKNKIKNIVCNRVEEFWRLYGETLSEMEQMEVAGEKVVQDLSVGSVHHHLELLPREVLWRIQDEWRGGAAANRDLEEVIFALAHSRHYPRLLGNALSGIVRKSSVRQSAKNSLSAGLAKSAVYSLRKLGKMIRSLK